MHRRTPKEIQAELKRHRDISFATIDYIIHQLESEDLSKNDFDFVSAYYEQQKERVEKNFQVRKLDLLQKLLAKLTMYPIHRADLAFNEYIKQKTGYKIDIFESLQTRVEGMIAQNRITSEKQVGDIFIMMEIYKKKSVDLEKVEVLKALLINYSNQRLSSKSSR